MFTRPRTPTSSRRPRLDRRRPGAVAGGRPAVAASTPRLTKATRPRLAKRDALAAAGLDRGDKFVISNCHKINGGAYTCQVMLIPTRAARAASGRPRSVVKGKLSVVKYTSAHCSG